MDHLYPLKAVVGILVFIPHGVPSACRHPEALRWCGQEDRASALQDPLHSSMAVRMEQTGKRTTSRQE